MLDILGSFVTNKAKKKINVANNPTPQKTLPIAPPQKAKPPEICRSDGFLSWLTLKHGSRKP